MALKPVNTGSGGDLLSPTASLHSLSTCSRATNSAGTPTTAAHRHSEPNFRKYAPLAAGLPFPSSVGGGTVSGGSPRLLSCDYADSTLDTVKSRSSKKTTSSSTSGLAAANSTFGRLTRKLIDQIKTDKMKQKQEEESHKIETFLELFNPNLATLGNAEKFDGSFEKDGEGELIIGITNRKERGAYVFGPHDAVYYVWQTIIAVACFYNLVMIVARAGIQEVQKSFRPLWYSVDYICDFIYILDMLVSCRTGYFLEGLTVVEPKLLFQRYIRSFRFKIDMVSILPYDVFYAIPLYSFEISQERVGRPFVVKGYDMPIWRNNRLLRCYKLYEFFQATEKRVNAPNAFRMLNLLFYISVIIHWNACYYYGISDMCVLGSTRWVYGGFDTYSVLRDLINSGNTFIRDYNESLPRAEGSGFRLTPCSLAVPEQNVTCVYPPSYLLNMTDVHEVYDRVGITLECKPNGVTYQFKFKEQPDIVWETYEYAQSCSLYYKYVYCMFWSALTLTTIGETPLPYTDLEYFFMIVDFLIGVVIFATIVGNVGSMIADLNAKSIAFQRKTDMVKVFMTCQGVSSELQVKVIKWFDYLKRNDRSLDEDNVLVCLAPRLRAEIAVHIHLDTLKKVSLFSDFEVGLMIEILLRLKPEVYSPGDFICKKGDIGRKMYIVKQGTLNVIAGDFLTVLGTLSNGHYFGEISVLDIPGNRNGNKRTANVQSVAFTELFSLSKDDIMEALHDYPQAKAAIYEKGKSLLAHDDLYNPELDNDKLDLEGEADERLKGVEHNYALLASRYAKLYDEVKDMHQVLIDKLNMLSPPTDNIVNGHK